jgi:hypothetical protein
VGGGDGVYRGATSLRELCGTARRAMGNWQLVAKLGFASREMRFLAAQASLKRSLAAMLPRKRNLLQRLGASTAFRTGFALALAHLPLLRHRRRETSRGSDCLVEHCCQTNKHF